MSASTVALSTLRYHEPITNRLEYVTDLEEIYVTGKSDFQEYKLVKLSSFGKALVLDNQMQSAQSDEAVYHESLVHPAMCSHPNPKRVFIGGGGEGATVREVLKHKCVEKCVMVDIDEPVVKFCREHMPEWNAGIWEDERFEVYFDDAKKWLEEAAARGEPKWDVIIFDISDPIDCGPGWVLYTKEFYTQMAKEWLAPGGVFISQCTGVDFSSPGNPEMEDPFIILNHTLKGVFKQVVGSAAHVPSFFMPWGFNMCAQEGEGTKLLDSDSAPEKIDELLVERMGAETAKALRHYDGITHRHITSLPRAVRVRIAEETRELTMNTPQYTKNLVKERAA